MQKRSKVKWGNARRVILFLLRVLSLAVAVFAVGPSLADEARFFYDELGRLVRVIDGEGNVATWTYDAVGNILRIDRTTIDQLNPQITGITPDFGRRGSTFNVTISGTGLLASTMTAGSAGITGSNIKSTDTVVSATLSISDTAQEGNTIITIDTGFATATVPFQVYPPAPTPLLSPNVLTLEPNGQTATLRIALSNPDPFPTTVSLRANDISVLSVSPEQLTIPAGQTSADVTVTTRFPGFGAVTADTGGGNAKADVIVVAPFKGPAFATAVVSIDLPAPLVPQTFTPLMAPFISIDLPAPLLSTFDPLLAPLVSVKPETIETP